MRVCSTAGMPVLDRRSLNRALLARQLLLEPSTLPVEQALAHLVGMQAQSPQAPYFGLWTRLKAFRPEELSGLIERRRVVRIALMRSTVHLVTAADCLTLRPLLQPAVEKGLTAGTPRGRLLATIDRPELAVAARTVLEERACSNTELAAALDDRFPGIGMDALVSAVRTDLPLIQVPPRGLWRRVGQARSTTAESWLGRPLAATPSVDDLVLRYLAAFGPAAVRDVQAWSGLTRLAEVMDRLRPSLLEFRSEVGAVLYDLPDAPRPSPDASAPIALLPEFDNILLSHADRDRIIDKPTLARVFTENGIIRGGVLIDGFVAGAWKLRQTAKSATVSIEPMARWTIRQRAAVEGLALDVVRFAAPEAQPAVDFIS